MRIRFLGYLAAAGAVLAMFSCATFPAALYERDASLQAALAKPPAYPDVRFAVLSDPHLMDPALWGEGAAIEAYLREDRKLLRESSDILEEAVHLLKELPADLVLVPGDLTKDGERSSHLLMAERLRAIEAAGKKVFVICGNHDVLNREAFRYDGEARIPVDSVSPEEFAEIFAEFGYGEALNRDPASLSYVAEPLPGLQILALDGCLYREKPIDGHSPAGGRFSEATLHWIDAILAAAAVAG
ncbi:MAG: metallophosphoesterase [Acidobacteria bacterium]|nr:metallophosphoesterase [Acidobacteriota bacterium]